MKKKVIEKIETPHDVYLFSPWSEAELFYRQCRNVCESGIYGNKRGIITISGMEVTVPEWMPLQPFDFISKKTIIL